MGYSHYWERPSELEPKAFMQWATDCARILGTFANVCGIRMGNAFGEGKPDLTADKVFFNGLKACEHEEDFKIRDCSCPGDCSFETFGISRRDKYEVNSAKTDQRPYDIAVTACLLMFKHRFGDAVKIRSDGNELQWASGQELAFFSCGIMPRIPATIRPAKSKAEG